VFSFSGFVYDEWRQWISVAYIGLAYFEELPGRQTEVPPSMQRELVAGEFMERANAPVLPHDVANLQRGR
jgi:hypothetical protein